MGKEILRPRKHKVQEGMQDITLERTDISNDHFHAVMADADREIELWRKVIEESKHGKRK